MYCKYCGKKVDSNSKRCKFCGGITKTTVIKCEHCGNINDSDSNYCMSCGKRIKPEDKLKIQYVLVITLIIMVVCTTGYLLNI